MVNSSPVIPRTHPFNGHFSGTTRVSQNQKGKTNQDFTEARDSEWQWHQLDHMQGCREITMPAPHHSVFTGRMPFLPPNQQHQSTEEIHSTCEFTRKSAAIITHMPDR